MAPGPTAQVVPARAGSAPASAPLDRLLAPCQVPHWNTHPVPASTWGTASVSGAEQEASTPSSVQLPPPSSRAVLTPAPLPCGDSPDWDSSTAQLGQDGNSAQLVGPGGRAAAQMVIFKSQTLSSTVISVSPPARPGADRHSGPTLAAQGLQPSSLP